MSIQITNERGEKLKELILDFSTVIGSGFQRIKEFDVRYPLLSTIDFYGHTIFNILQLRFLIEELERLQTELIDPTIEKPPLRTNYPEYITEETIIRDLNSIISFANLDTHEYLKFIGD